MKKQKYYKNQAKCFRNLCRCYKQEHTVSLHESNAVHNCQQKDIRKSMGSYNIVTAVHKAEYRPWSARLQATCRPLVCIQSLCTQSKIK